MPAGSMKILVVLKHPRQNHGTGYGNSHAEHKAGNRGPAEAPPHNHPKHRSHGDLHHRAGDSHPLHSNQVFQMEMEANPEHQQNNAQLRKLLHCMAVRYKARRIRPYDNAGQQVPYQRGQVQLSGNETEKKSGGQAADECKNEAEIVIHKWEE